MRAVLISIRPEWCEKIESGQKTIEIRKTKPKLKTPFKCYIYCTKSKTSDKNGKVIGEFICTEIKTIDVLYPAYHNELDKKILEQSCLSYFDLHHYAYHDDVYGWHISNLMIYDKPKELMEFTKQNELKLTKAPQSWYYVNGR